VTNPLRTTSPTLRSLFEQGLARAVDDQEGAGLAVLGIAVERHRNAGGEVAKKVISFRPSVWAASRSRVFTSILCLMEVTHKRHGLGADTLKIGPMRNKRLESRWNLHRIGPSRAGAELAINIKARTARSNTIDPA
jgi:hypothetical protein